MLIGIICIIATIYQSVLLLNNYNLKATLMKNTEELNNNPMETPNIVLCSDPPHHDPDTDFIRESGRSLTSEPLNLQIGRIKTALKVLTNISNTLIGKLIIHRVYAISYQALLMMEK